MPDLAKIEDDDIVIRVSIATIPLAVNAGWATHKVETPVRVDDPKEFAKQMLYTLNAEQDGRSGNTLVMDIMDQAINGAIEFGAGEVITEEEAEALAASFQSHETKIPNKYKCERCAGSGEEPEASPKRKLSERLDQASDNLEAEMNTLTDLGNDGGTAMIIGDAIDAMRGEAIRLRNLI